MSASSSYLYRPEHPGHIFGYGPGRRLFARSGQVIHDLPADYVKLVNQSVPGMDGGPCLVPTSTLAERAEPQPAEDPPEEEKALPLPPWKQLRWPRLRALARNVVPSLPSTVKKDDVTAALERAAVLTPERLIAAYEKLKQP